MSKVNKHGLSRDIPEPIKRQVRRNCGFGCIFCGLWIYQYEHILPEFRNAKEHNSDKICLLCPNHHQKVTNKIISKEQVIIQYKNPKALERGYSNDYLTFKSPFNVVLGRVLFLNSTRILSINKDCLIGFEQPEKDEPMKLNGKFYDNNGNLLIEIVKNEFRGFTANWDIEQVGNRTIIRNSNNKICLHMIIEAPDLLKLEIVDMTYKNAEFSSNSLTGAVHIKAVNGAGIDFPSGQIITEGINITNTGIEFNKLFIIGAQSGLRLNEMDYKEFFKSGRMVSKSS